MNKENEMPLRRKRERGAALVTMLLVSTLLLASGSALIIATSMTATNTFDQSTETQAYYAAEAGMQAALSVLRGHIAPNPLFNTASSTADENKITFRQAVTHPTLGRWLTYSTTNTDRVPVTTPYTPLTGMAYNINVIDPDNSSVVTFTTSGQFFVGGTLSNPLSFGSGSTAQTITFTGRSTAVSVNTASTTATNLGTFSVNTSPNPGTVPSNSTFRLTINQTLPWEATGTITCSVSGSISNSSSTVDVNCPNQAISMGGVIYTFSNNPLRITHSGTTTMSNSLAPPEPRRLLVRVVGFGPRGARKQMQSMVENVRLAVSAPAPIVIRGSDDGTPMTFDLGSSNAKNYTGVDQANPPETQKPTVAITLGDWTAADTGIKKGATVASPQLSVLDVTPIPPLSSWNPLLTPVPTSLPPVAKTPNFLVTANSARAFLNDAEIAARTMGAYHSGSYTGTVGSDSPYIPVFRFIDGDCYLDGGAGMLIVTGTVYLTGNRAFKGIILVLGGGTVNRDGGGSGNTFGSWIVAKFNRTSGPFLAPSFNVAGGGSSTFAFDSKLVKDANAISGRRMVGLVEY